MKFSILSTLIIAASATSALSIPKLFNSNELRHTLPGPQAQATTLTPSKSATNPNPNPSPKPSNSFKKESPSKEYDALISKIKQLADNKIEPETRLDELFKELKPILGQFLKKHESNPWVKKVVLKYKKEFVKYKIMKKGLNLGVKAKRFIKN